MLLEIYLSHICAQNLVSHSEHISEDGDAARKLLPPGHPKFTLLQFDQGA